MNTSNPPAHGSARGHPRTTLASIALAVVCTTPPAIAASDRVLEFVSVTPSQELEGAWDIIAHSRLLVENQPTLPANFSTRVEFYLNGSLFNAVISNHTLLQQPASGCECAQTCYTGLLNGQPDNGWCVPYTSPPTLDDCRCVSGGIDTTLLGSQTALVLLPGDMIEVRLVPAPGALPDNPANNSLEFAFNGAPREILRSIESVTIEHGPDGPELLVTISAAPLNAEGPVGNVGLGSQITLLGFNPPPGLPVTLKITKSFIFFGCRFSSSPFGCSGPNCSDASGCSEALGCSPFPILGQSFECWSWQVPNYCPQPPCFPPLFGGCGCKVKYAWSVPLASVNLTAGQTVNIQLATAPGGTADVNTGDNYFTFVIPDEPCPGDTNGDGVVDSNDLGTLLGQFGIPCP